MIRLAAYLIAVLFLSTAGALSQGVSPPAAADSDSNLERQDPASAGQPGAIAGQNEAVHVLPVVIDARIGEHPDRTRFVVEVSDPFPLRVFALPSPERVVIDMPEVLWQLKGPPQPSGRGLVRSYRYGLFRAGDSRFVIDLNGPARVAEPLVLPPQDGHGYRLVIDLFSTSAASFAQTAGWPADLRAAETPHDMATTAAPARLAPGTSTQGLSPNASRLASRVIVIDPGHGGIDSGTTGVDGLVEKDLVLDESLRLGRELQKRGYVMRLTRQTDIYIPLRERVSIARGYNADLFISLHADSNPDTTVYGASVYTLSESASDREAAALARKENQSDVIAGVDLAGESSPVASILIGLAQRDSMNKSGRFAESAVAELSRATDVLPREPHRSAGFMVLKAPDVPAVLIELGYLSNAHDCAQVRSNGWRDAVASAIADAVDRHFGTGTPAQTAVTKQAAK